MFATLCSWRETQNPLVPMICPCTIPSKKASGCIAVIRACEADEDDEDQDQDQDDYDHDGDDGVACRDGSDVDTDDDDVAEKDRYGNDHLGDCNSEVVRTSGTLAVMRGSSPQAAD